MQREQSAESGPISFRPSATLRVVGGIIGALAMTAFLVAIVSLAASDRQAEWFRKLAPAILLLPCILSAVVLRRRVVVEEGGLTSYSLAGARRITWSELRRVDVRRGSFTLETGRGPISASLIDPRDRDLLLRAVIERAKLAKGGEEPRWGLDAQYFPRRQDIAFSDFVPHNQRDRPKQ